MLVAITGIMIFLPRRVNMLLAITGIMIFLPRRVNMLVANQQPSTTNYSPVKPSKFLRSFLVGRPILLNRLPV